MSVVGSTHVRYVLLMGHRFVAGGEVIGMKHRQIPQGFKGGGSDNGGCDDGIMRRRGKGNEGQRQRQKFPLGAFARWAGFLGGLTH